MLADLARLRRERRDAGRVIEALSMEITALDRRLAAARAEDDERARLIGAPTWRARAVDIIGRLGDRGR